MSIDRHLPFASAAHWKSLRQETVSGDSLAESLERRDLTAAAQGDCHAYQRLVLSYQDRIYQLCFRLLGCRDDAAEACQDVFVRAFQALPRYRPEAKFSTWLHQIALNRCRDWRKQRSHRLRLLSDSLQAQEDPDLPCGKEQPDAQAGWSDEVARLEQGLAAIAPRHREIFVLVCVENLPHRECALILNCSERAIEGRLYRARKALQRWWESQPQDPSFS
ncbi:RNA polymerase sigma factor [Roseibacillus ishigakijimensis]|uniref:RNA polymerase sigma factor n=1 Tax=Roseibacillus ishigakijimensis TaxID=454146 RepID=A0A934RQB0_9BACT|nr:RNA polymerase sigma factor [Roseibacillus ishigakijimensis]MBK1833503.1 RNA polymerase sigma factor [Roseibacillus ishigakijimensis]